MAYKLMKRVIARARKNGMLEAEKAEIQEKLDVFLAGNRITTAEYQELSGMVREEDDE